MARKTYLRVLDIITFPILLPVFIIWFISRYILAPLFLRLGQLILGFLVAGGIAAGIAHLLIYIFS
ncbi:hypothetical protein [Mesomycoplasma ovipneumoniae]|uniref:hypothetical protein n=1 Tax=Mesomycoplasma ovipneumoniae TaxID=29562 RepID=UPI002964F786|nr:hypothetical protein [Mesomycoplasma ovipneumoniae]MDW2920296.1 hypothetical protein [Mesomycoplasma ovipneumoniae]